MVLSTHHHALATCMINLDNFDTEIWLSYRMLMDLSQRLRHSNIGYHACTEDIGTVWYSWLRSYLNKFSSQGSQILAQSHHHRYTFHSNSRICWCLVLAIASEGSIHKINSINWLFTEFPHIFCRMNCFSNWTL